MILVIGATGYIGRYLCPYLQNKGYDVLALGRSKNVKLFFEERGIAFKYFDITDERSFDSIDVEGVEAIIDLAACLAEIESPVEQLFKVNTIGVYNTLEFARKKGIKKVVVTSTHKVYNDVDKVEISENDGISFRGDHSPYIISKIAAENFIEYYNKDFDLNAVALRLTGVHGYGEMLGHLNSDGSYKKSTFELFFERALDGEPIEVWGNPNIKRDHIYVKDVLTALEATINSRFAKGVFNIATGVGYSLLDEAKALVKVFGDGRSIIAERPEKPGLSRGYIYDISKAQKELNWTPKYSDLVTMLEDYKIEWERKEYHNYRMINESDRPRTL